MRGASSGNPSLPGCCCCCRCCSSLLLAAPVQNTRNVQQQEKTRTRWHQHCSLLVSFRQMPAVVQRDGHTGCLGYVHCCPSFIWEVIQPSVTIGGTFRQVGCRKLVIMKKKRLMANGTKKMFFVLLPSHLLPCIISTVHSTRKKNLHLAFISTLPLYCTGLGKARQDKRAVCRGYVFHKILPSLSTFMFASFKG